MLPPFLSDLQEITRASVGITEGWSKRWISDSGDLM